MLRNAVRATRSALRSSQRDVRESSTPNCIYHVTSRGTRALRYSSPTTIEHTSFGSSKGRACVDGLICHAYCLMGNHYHLLVEAPAGNLSVAMHRINSGFAKHFNLEHDVEGHVFERRYRSWVMGGRGARDGGIAVRRPQSGASGHLCDSRGLAMVEPCSDRWHRASPELPHRRHRARLVRRHGLGGNNELSGFRGRRARRASSSDRPLRNSSIEALSMKSRRRTRSYGYSLREIAQVVGLSAGHTQQKATSTAVKHWHQARCFRPWGY